MRHLTLISAALLLSAVARAEQAVEARRALDSKLETARVTFEFKEAGLGAVCEWFLTHADLPVIASDGAKEKFAENKTTITAKLSDVKLGTALRLVFETHGLETRPGRGVIRVQLEGEVPGEIQEEMIDVRDMLDEVQSFVGPHVGLPSPESFDSSSGDERPKFLTPEKLDELIHLLTGGDGVWKKDDVFVMVYKGWVIVRNTAEIVQKVRDAVGKLGALK